MPYHHHSPSKRAQLMKKMPAKGKLEAAMKEVHTNIPSTVEKANVSGKKREAMIRAIAFSKARKRS